LPANADYLRRRFRIDAAQKVLVTPIWGDGTLVRGASRAAVRRRHALPASGTIAVFGGQLVEGRGFEQMFAAADAALRSGSDLKFLFVGEGRLGPAIQERAATRGNVLYRAQLSRPDYLELLGACDVGMVATVPGVTSFSIPSKTIDYLRAGLPIIAAVEHGNDFVRILEDYGVGAAVPFGRAELFFTEAERLASGGKITAAAARCLEEVFDVRHAVATVLDACGQNAQATPRQEPSRLSHRLPNKRSAAPTLLRS
jgi:glycosyltransferase involved in cell wall biosynthesis